MEYDARVYITCSVILTLLIAINNLCQTKINIIKPILICTLRICVVNKSKNLKHKQK